MLGNLPDLISTRFQTVSGLSRQIDIQPVRAGGENSTYKFLSRGTSFSNLTLERGVMTVSPLSGVMDFVMGSFQTRAITFDADIMLLDGQGLPVATWSVSRAIPVKMSIGSLEASAGKILINAMEFACEKVEWLGVKL